MPSPIWKIVRIFCFLLVFPPLLTSSALAQAFYVASVLVQVVSTDLVALTGKVEFTVNSGTTGAGVIVLAYDGVTISNTTLSGITISDTCGSGNAALLAVDQAKGLVKISSPSGCLPGEKLTLEGVRVDIAASGVSSVVANISALVGAGFGFVAGGTKVKVIGVVTDGLIVKADSDTVLTYQNNVMEISGQFFKVSEGFASSFGDTLTLGQTVATRIKIQVKGVPANSSLTFPSSVTESVTGATLTAVNSSLLTLPTSSGDTTITYKFASAGSSKTKTETFEIQYRLDVAIPPSEPAVVSLQASLFPFDSPNVPRFESRFLPADEDLPLPEFDDFLPVLRAEGQFTGIAFTNPVNLESTVQLEAFGLDGVSVTGSDITNPTTLVLAALAQKAVLLEELFGSGISTAEVGTIRAQSRRARTVSLFLLGDNSSTFLDGSTTGQNPLTNFLFPDVAHRGTSPVTSVNIVNPSSSTSVEVQLTLHSDAGTPVATSETVTLAPGGTLSRDLTGLLGVDPSGLSGGYVRGTATGPVVAFESFGDTQALNVLNAQNPDARQETYHIPHFAVGAGYDTELNLINTHPSQTAVMDIWALDDDGVALAGGVNPVAISLEPGVQMIFGMASSFGFPEQEFATGSLRIDVEAFFLGFFPSFPTLSGSIRFATERLSASLPLSSTLQPSALFPHVAQTAALFTGVAMVNTQATPVSQIVEVFSQSGVLVGSTTLTLAAGARKTALLAELVPLSDGQSGGYFRVRRTAIRDVLFSGSHDGASASANLVHVGRSTLFTSLGIRRFIDIVRNVTDGSEGVIAKIESSTITATLSGGTGSSNVWDDGDQYEILDGSKPGAVSFALFGDLAGEFLSVIPSQFSGNYIKGVNEINGVHRLLRQESTLIRFGTQADENMVTLGPKDGGYPKYPPYDGKNSLNIKMPLATAVLAPLDLEFIGYNNRNAAMKNQMRPFDDLELCFKSINNEDIRLVMCIYHLRSSPLLPQLFKNKKCDIRPDWNIGDENVAKAGLIYYEKNTSKYPYSEMSDPCGAELGSVYKRGEVIGYSGAVGNNPHVGFRFKVLGKDPNPLTEKGKYENIYLHWVQPSVFFKWKCFNPNSGFDSDVLAYPFDCNLLY